MTNPPPLIEVDDAPGKDFASRWDVYIEAVYRHYLKTVAFGELTFSGLPVKCRFHPETDGKHYAFWHMMQEGGGGRGETDRTPDLERCRRVGWIAWVIKNAGTCAGIRVFKQAPRQGETSWVLWLYEHRYVVILWERNGYFLLKTAFMVKPHKEQELQRDWRAFRPQKG